MRLRLAPEWQSFEVVDQIGHADFGRCPGDADGSHEQLQAILLLGEDMLDTRADF